MISYGLRVSHMVGKDYASCDSMIVVLVLFIVRCAWYKCIVGYAQE